MGYLLFVECLYSIYRLEVWSICCYFGLSDDVAFELPSWDLHGFYDEVLELFGCDITGLMLFAVKGLPWSWLYLSPTLLLDIINQELMYQSNPLIDISQPFLIIDLSTFDKQCNIPFILNNFLNKLINLILPLIQDQS